MKRTLMMVTGTALVLAACSSFADDDIAIVGYRQKVMKGIGANIAAIGDILKFKLPYEKNILGHAQAMHADAMLVSVAFEKKADSPKSMAKPEVWDKHKDFTADVDKLVDQTAKLVKVAEAGDMAAIGAQMKELGKSCQDCHEEFRKPEPK